MRAPMPAPDPVADRRARSSRGSPTGRLVAALVLAWAALAAMGGSAAAMSSMDDPPPGANDFSCKPSPAHPRPVVLVHGLGATMGENWSYISPILAEKGYCVFALTYGLDPESPFPFGGVIPIERSAPELRAFVARVLAATEAPEVDLVGHSEGTVMPQYWLKFLDGARFVKRYVALTPLYDGTTVGSLDRVRDIGGQLGLSQAAIDAVAVGCGSCPQFLRGSAMMEKLRSGDGPAVRGVSYTTIPTHYDELVNPWQSGLLDAPNATNMVLQGVCPNDRSEHLEEAFDPVVAQIALNALDPAMAVKPSCSGGEPRYAPGPHLIETKLRGFARRFTLRRLTLRSVPVGARVRVSCRGPKHHAADSRRARPSRSCPGPRSFKATKTVLVRKLRPPFRGRHLRTGTRVRVSVAAPGLRGKRFTLRVGERGGGRPLLRCTAPSGGPARC